MKWFGYLRRTGAGKLSAAWGCYHTELYEFSAGGERLGVLGCAVGAPFAVLVAEEMFASGCELVVSVTSAGQIVAVRPPPYFVLATRAYEGLTWRRASGQSRACSTNSRSMNSRARSSATVKKERTKSRQSARTLE